MKVSRAGVVKNLNARPLAYGLEERDDFIIETPARVVALYEQGELEVALVPIIEIAKHDTWEVLLDCGAVSVKGPARSVIAVHSKPWSEVTKIAVDTHGRNAGVLMQILLAKKLAPGREFVVDRMDIDPGHIPAGYDAAVVTGDRALLWPNYDPLTGNHKFAQLLLTDLGSEWAELTGLPLVLYVWSGRSGQDYVEWHERVAQAAQDGDKNFEPYLERLSHRLGPPFTAEFLGTYLGDTVSYEFGENEIRGFLRFLDEAASLNLFPLTEAKKITFRSLNKNVTAGVPDTLTGAHELVSMFSAPRAKVDYLAKAKYAFFRRQYRKALRAMDDGADDAPAFNANPTVQLLRGRCNYHLTRATDARANLTRALDDQSTERVARYWLARMAMDAKRHESAAQILRELITDYPTDISYTAHAHGLLASSAMYRGLSHSHDHYRELAERPQLTSSDLLVEHGRSLLIDHLWDEAAAYFGEAVNVDPTNPAAYYELARLFFLHGQFLKAEEIMAYGLEQAQEEVLFFTLLGDLRRVQEKYADAATLYRLALEISPRGNQADYLISNIAHCLYRQGAVAEARSHFMVVSKHFPRSKRRKDAEFFAECLKSLDDGDVPERITMVQFPNGVQLTGISGPRAAAQILAYHGYEVNPRAVADDYLSDDASWPDVRRFAENAGFRVVAIRGNRDAVHALLEHDVPLLIADTRGLDDQFVSLVGYDLGKQALVVQDPKTHAQHDVPWPEVEANWRPSAGCVLVMVPEDHVGVLDEMGLTDDPLLVAWFAALDAHAAEDFDAARALALEAANLDLTAEPPQKLLVEMDIDADRAEDAKARCEAVLDQNPRCFWAKKYLGDALLALDRLSEAATTYQEAKQWVRDESALWWAQGLAFELNGHLVRARQCYRRSLELETISPVALRMAQVCRQQNRPFEAAYWWEVALELDAECKEARDNLAWFDEVPRTPQGRREATFAPFVRRIPLVGDEGGVADDEATVAESGDGSDELHDAPPEVDLLGPEDTFDNEAAVIAQGGVTDESDEEIIVEDERTAGDALTDDDEH